ncbi:MAG: hypothetical protein O6765_03530 [Gammaproteobacteria bacterium]|nr:hypothetical protein [Gammaproteobacteria bacterium]
MTEQRRLKIMNSETTSSSGFTRNLITVAVVLAVVLSAGGSRAAG